MVCLRVKCLLCVGSKIAWMTVAWNLNFNKNWLPELAVWSSRVHSLISKYYSPFLVIDLLQNNFNFNTTYIYTTYIYDLNE